MAHQKQIYVFCFTGTFFAILGFAAIICIPGLISFMVHKKMALVPSNPSFPLWRDLDLPIYQKFYFFNVTNPKEVEWHGAKPILTEVGPFVYRLNLSKSSLTFGDNQTSLKFRETKRYYFDRELSVADLNISLTTLNVPLAVVYDTIDLDSLNFLIRPWVKKFLSKHSFFFTATPYELIFAGKESDISEIGHMIDPKKNPTKTFAYFAGQNNSNDGLWEINTGLASIREVNSVISLNGSSHLDFWDGEQCNRINGSSNGELFPPLDVVNGPNKTMQFFRSDFCRVFNLSLAEAGIPAEVGGSMAVDRFRPVANMFANATVNPINSCYKPNPNITNVSTSEIDVQALINFIKKKILGEAFVKLNETKNNNLNSRIITKSFSTFVERPSGVFDLSACHQGLPIFVSYPHFLEADPIYLAPFEGLKPNLSKHETYIDIEPVTGTPVDFLARIQINIAVNTSQARNVKMASMMFPTMWQEFSIHITDKMAHTISFQTRTPRIAAFSIATLVAVIGICLVLYGSLLIFINLHRKRMNKHQTPLLSDQDTDQMIDREDSTNNNSIVTD